MINQSVFLDTNFLISLQIKGHRFHEDSLSILKSLISKEANFYTYPVIFDEFWYVLQGIWKRHSDFGEENMENKLLLATHNIFDIPGFKLLTTQLTKRDLLENIGIMDKYNLRPRDALIVKVMEKEGIDRIVSFDDDFDAVKSFTRIFR